MTERKCGVCRKPGHTRATCPGTMEEQMSQSDRVAESGGTDITGPVHTGANPGPWFEAQFPGICERGGEGFDQGEEIRADGEGGYECRGCVMDEPAVPAPQPIVVTDAGTALDDFFSAPAPVETVVHERGPHRTDRYGHRMKDPVLGDFRRHKNGKIKSIPRVTTFNKAVESTESLTGWMKRNVLLGAAARPDIAAQAHGKTHDDHKDFLNVLVKQLEEEAGSAKAADVGKFVHKLTEEFDAGRVALGDIPPAYRPLVTLYRDALREAGLRVVPSLLEASTFVEEWGGVSGSFDKVYEHVPTGQYFIGDVKTGKTMDFGWAPIECQIAIYAHGYNRHGTYDWDDEVWRKPTLRVSHAVGIVIHLPVKGDHVGTCRVLSADLYRGWDYAALCGAVKATRSAKAAPTPWNAPVAADWETEFSRVPDTDAAGRLWLEAKAAGVEPAELQRLVALAQDRLRSMS